MMTLRLIIVHGFMATPEHHWFSWLKQEAESIGMKVSIPAMPNPESPEENAWLATLQKEVGTIDDDTWFVGHSLGCITILRYLTRQPAGVNAAGAIMVSGFSERLAQLPELDAFNTLPLDAENIIRKIPLRAVIASLNDEIVPADYTLRLSQQMQAAFYGLPESGHFLDRDGCRELPLLSDLLKDFLKRHQYKKIRLAGE